MTLDLKCTRSYAFEKCIWKMHLKNDHERVCSTCQFFKARIAEWNRQPEFKSAFHLALILLEKGMNPFVLPTPSYC